MGRFCKSLSNYVYIFCLLVMAEELFKTQSINIFYFLEAADVI
jgi:hypothetical protein